MNIYDAMLYTVFLITTCFSILCLHHLAANHGLVLHCVCLKSTMTTYDAAIPLCYLPVDHLCHYTVSVSSTQDPCYIMSPHLLERAVSCCTMFSSTPHPNHVRCVIFLPLLLDEHVCRVCYVCIIPFIKVYNSTLRLDHLFENCL